MFTQWNARARFIGLWLIGSLAAVWHLRALPDSAMNTGFEVIAVARSLAAGQGFSNPYQMLPTGPTAHCAPVYPWLVAQLLRWCGGAAAATAPLVVAHLLMHGLQVALLPLVSLRLLGRQTPGLFASGLLLLPILPPLVQLETVPLALCLLLALLLPVRPWNAAPAALWGAFTLHVNPAGLFVLGGWLWAKRPARRWLVIYLLTFAAACLPWAVRNYTTLGVIGLVRDNLPLELYVSNNDISNPSMLENPGLARFHPNTSMEEARAVQALGEGAYMRDRGRRAMAWISAHPGPFLRLTALRVWRYWFPRIAVRPWQAALLALVTLLALPGLYRLRRNPVFFAAVVLSPPIYYVIQSEPHYRYPLLWATVLAAGVTLEDAAVWWRARRSLRASA